MLIDEYRLSALSLSISEKLQIHLFQIPIIQSYFCFIFTDDEGITVEVN